jgi:hypothetical protein
MSASTKRPDGSSGANPPGAQKPESQTSSAKTGPAQKPPVQGAPAVVVSRTIDVAGNATKARPAATTVAATTVAATTVKVAQQAPAAAPAPAAPASAPKQAAAPPAAGTTRAASSSATSLFATHARAAATTPKMEQAKAQTKPDPKAEKVEPKPKSVRPTAPELMAVTEAPDSGGSLAGTFEKLLGAEVDQSFEFAAKLGSSPPPAEGMAEADLAEVRALFAQLAANHVRQVRDFMIDLRWGEATIEWISICSPALKSLRRAADKLEIAELVTALDVFWQHLTNTQAKAGGRTIDGEPRDIILAAYDKLVSVMPQAFALDMDRAQREAAILQSLLMQIPEVKKVTIDKLYSAGLTTLEAMLLATPGDIAATTGIDVLLAHRIVNRFRDYRDQVVAGVPDATRAQERDRIAKLTARLRMEHDAFESAARGWSREDQERKKTSREARARTLLDIQVVLARLGEVERLKEIEKLPFEKKLAHLESFLEEARDKYVAQP